MRLILEVLRYLIVFLLEDNDKFNSSKSNTGVAEYRSPHRIMPSVTIISIYFLFQYVSGFCHRRAKRILARDNNYCHWCADIISLAGNPYGVSLERYQFALGSTSHLGFTINHSSIKWNEILIRPLWQCNETYGRAIKPNCFSCTLITYVSYFHIDTMNLDFIFCLSQYIQFSETVGCFIEGQGVVCGDFANIECTLYKCLHAFNFTYHGPVKTRYDLMTTSHCMKLKLSLYNI